MWTKYGKTFDDMCKEKLANPGTLIRVAEHVYLIGHINELGGVCDHCMEIGGSTVIIEYQVVWSNS